RDWSSDVCSSDLIRARGNPLSAGADFMRNRQRQPACRCWRATRPGVRRPLLGCDDRQFGFAIPRMPAVTVPASHALSPSRGRGVATSALVVLLLLTGCATRPAQVQRTPAQVRTDIVQRMPGSVADRTGWAADIQVALSAQDLAPTA